MGMGFNEQQATKALKATDNNLERAVDWIFSHTDELNAMDTGEVDEVVATPTQKHRDGGSSKYFFFCYL
jgi:ubiquitin carboxyl-terminal hydrolase 5/13